MKRIFLTAGVLALAIGSQALAADLPPAAPQPRAPAAYIPAPVFSWTGIYVGINGGGEFGQSSWSSPGLTPTGNFSTNGFLIGGTLGGNYQFGQFVIGLEGDGDWTDINGTFTGTGGTGCGFGCKTGNDWLATIRGRAGWAWDRVLFYGTGGAAFGNIQASYAGASLSTVSTQTGWTAGAGVEWAFLPNWTAKFEYLYVDLGNTTCATAICAPNSPVPLSTTVTLTENIVRAGVNYKFW
jgi:outer membrane immunogenic protein